MPLKAPACGFPEISPSSPRYQAVPLVNAICEDAVGRGESSPALVLLRRRRYQVGA